MIQTSTMPAIGTVMAAPSQCHGQPRAVTGGGTGGLTAAPAAGWGTARWWAWEPRWLVRVRHAGAEAGWRVGSLWGEFGDWVRLGR